MKNPGNWQFPEQIPDITASPPPDICMLPFRHIFRLKQGTGMLRLLTPRVFKRNGRRFASHLSPAAEEDILRRFRDSTSKFRVDLEGRGLRMTFREVPDFFGFMVPERFRKEAGESVFVASVDLDLGTALIGSWSESIALQHPFVLPGFDERDFIDSDYFERNLDKKQRQFARAVKSVLLEKQLEVSRAEPPNSAHFGCIPAFAQLGHVEKNV